jgi:hypothetical protein
LGKRTHKGVNFGVLFLPYENRFEGGFWVLKGTLQDDYKRSGLVFLLLFIKY